MNLKVSRKTCADMGRSNLTVMGPEWSEAPARRQEAAAAVGRDNDGYKLGRGEVVAAEQLFGAGVNNLNAEPFGQHIEGSSLADQIRGRSTTTRVIEASFALHSCPGVGPGRGGRREQSQKLALAT